MVAAALPANNNPPTVAAIIALNGLSNRISAPISFRHVIVEFRMALVGCYSLLSLSFFPKQYYYNRQQTDNANYELTTPFLPTVVVITPRTVYSVAIVIATIFDSFGFLSLCFFLTPMNAHT